MIRIGIIGYGKLGREAERAVLDSCDAELSAIFTRRVEKVKAETKSLVLSFNLLEGYSKNIDIMLLCGGSATDLPVQMPIIAKYCSFVDSYDNHAKIPEYFSEADKILRENKQVGIVSAGWDPGIFSMQRLIGKAFLKHSNQHTFWGSGVSQGHSDAVRRIRGVKHAIQYTIPKPEALEAVRNGRTVSLNAHDMHIRRCYIVPCESSVDEWARIENAVKENPDYFKGYETEVFFIDEEEFINNHSSTPHGGLVISEGVTADQNMQHMEFSLKLKSNPAFCASILLVYARAAFRLKSEGVTGAKTVFDVPLSYLSSKSARELIKDLL